MLKSLRIRVTIGGLLALVAACALAINWLRPPPPPDEGQAILLAKAHLATCNVFDYPLGYWARATWNPKRGVWRVGFVPARKDGGPTQLVEVARDRTCKTPMMDISFFDLW
jgi:hypothetical protein